MELDRGVIFVWKLSKSKECGFHRKWSRGDNHSYLGVSPPVHFWVWNITGLMLILCRTALVANGRLRTVKLQKLTAVNLKGACLRGLHRSHRLEELKPQTSGRMGITRPKDHT